MLHIALTNEPTPLRSSVTLQSQIATCRNCEERTEKTNCLNCTVKIVKLPEDDAATRGTKKGENEKENLH